MNFGSGIALPILLALLSLPTAMALASEVPEAHAASGNTASVCTGNSTTGAAPGSAEARPRAAGVHCRGNRKAEPGFSLNFAPQDALADLDSESEEADRARVLRVENEQFVHKALGITVSGDDDAEAPRADLAGRTPGTVPTTDAR